MHGGPKRVALCTPAVPHSGPAHAAGPWPAADLPLLSQVARPVAATTRGTCTRCSLTSPRGACGNDRAAQCHPRRQGNPPPRWATRVPERRAPARHGPRMRTRTRTRPMHRKISRPHVSSFSRRTRGTAEGGAQGPCRPPRWANAQADGSCSRWPPDRLIGRPTLRVSPVSICTATWTGVRPRPS